MVDRLLKHAVYKARGESGAAFKEWISMNFTSGAAALHRWTKKDTAPPRQAMERIVNGEHIQGPDAMVKLKTQQWSDRWTRDDDLKEHLPVLFEALRSRALAEGPPDPIEAQHVARATGSLADRTALGLDF
eukprot:11226652-Lingulodinium_polyedra.AAC.1